MSVSHATSTTSRLKAKAALATLISSQSPGGPLCRRGLCITVPSRSSTSQYSPSGRGGSLAAYETKLPEGYWLNRTNSDVWTLMGPQGQIVARFIAGAVDPEEVGREARKHREGKERGARFLTLDRSGFTGWLQALLPSAQTALITNQEGAPDDPALRGSVESLAHRDRLRRACELRGVSHPFRSKHR